MKGVLFWWVNQRRTYSIDRTEEVVFTSGDPSSRKVKRLGRVSPGDVFLHYDSPKIRAVGVAVSERQRGVHPERPDAGVGHFVKVGYFELEEAIERDEIPEEWRLEASAFNNKNPMPQRAFLMEVEREFVERLWRKFRSAFPVQMFPNDRDFGWAVLAAHEQISLGEQLADGDFGRPLLWQGGGVQGRHGGGRLLLALAEWCQAGFLRHGDRFVGRLRA